jgi:hypothetical protein
MAINFPSNPQINDTIVSGSTTWRYNGTAWAVVPPSSLTLSSLTSTDVNVTNLTVTGTVTGIDQSYNLSELTDVDLTTPPVDQQILQYNSAAQKWRAGTVASGGAAFNGGTITNPLFVNNATNSTSTSTGALRVAGGVSVGDDIFLAGSLVVGTGSERINMNSASEVRYFNDNNTGYVGFKAPSTVSTSRTYLLPQTDGTSGQVLRTNGSGVLSWVSVVSPTGGLAAPGQNTQIVFNDNDDFGADTGLTFDRTAGRLTTEKITATGDVTVSDTTESSSSTTGSLKVSGGVGILGQINVAGAVNKFTGDSVSTSITTGTMVVTGGLGVSGRINAGSTVSSDPAPSAAEHLTNKRYVDANVLAFSVAFGA